MTNYDTLVEAYLMLRREVEHINERAKEEVAVRRKSMAMIEAQITEAATAEGLETVNTPRGTGYWATHYNCSVENPAAFSDFVREHELWNLMETRASKTAVREYVEEQGTPPPGVTFGGFRVFNLREKHSAPRDKNPL